MRVVKGSLQMSGTFSSNRCTYSNQLLSAGRGQGLVEFALIVPLLLVFLIGIMEFSRMLAVYNGVSNSAREAARWGSVVGTNANGIRYFFDCAGMKAAAYRTSILTDLSQVEIIYEAPNETDGSFDEIGYCNESNVPRNTANTKDLEVLDLQNGYRIRINVTAHFAPIVPLLPIPERDYVAEAARTIYTNIEGAPQCNDGIDNDYDDADNDGTDYAVIGGDSDCESLIDQTEGPDFGASNCFSLTVLVQNTDIPTGLLGTATDVNISIFPTHSSDCDEGEFSYNATVTLIALNSDGNQWQSWTGTDSNTATTTILINGNKTAIAYFAGIQCYTLSLTHTGSGSDPTASPGPDCNGNTQYTYGTSVLITGLPAINYYLDSWSDGLGSTNPLSYTVNSASTITANYVSSTACKRLFIANTGLPSNYHDSLATYSPSSPNCTNAGNPDWAGSGNVTVTASKTIADGGITYVFTGWTGDFTTASNMLVLPMNSDRNITANYARCYQLNYTYDSLKGYISVNPTSSGGCTGLTYTSGTIVKLYPVGNQGYSFTGWIGGDVPSGQSSANPLQLTMTQDYLYLTANFVTSTGCYRLDLDEDPSGSTVVLQKVSPAPSCLIGSVSGYPANTNVLITVEPKTGYTFNYWTYGATTDPQQTTQIRMTSDVTAIAHITAPCYTFTVNVSPADSGTVTHALDPSSTSTTCSLSGGGTGYYPSAIVQINASNTVVGYVFKEWSDASLSSSPSTTVEVLGHVTVTANYEEKDYILNVCVASGVGSVSIAASGATTSTVGECVSKTYGANASNVEFSATGDPGSGFLRWLDANGNILSTDPSESITLDSDKTYRAVFVDCYSLDKSTISPTGAGGISASPAPTCQGGTKYTADTVVTLTASPVSIAYQAGTWGGDVTGSGSTTTLTLNSNKIVSHTFDLVCLTVTLKQSPSRVPANTAIITTSAPSGCSHNTSTGQYQFHYGDTFTVSWGGPVSGYDTFNQWTYSSAMTLASGSNAFSSTTSFIMLASNSDWVQANYYASCISVSSGLTTIIGNFKALQINYTNSTAAQKKIRQIVVNFPTWSGNRLEQVTFAGYVLWTSSTGSGLSFSPATLRDGSSGFTPIISTWTDSNSYINSGVTSTVTLTFKNNVHEGNFSIATTFSDGCTATTVNK